MASRHAEVRQAYASYFPSFSLTGTVGYSSPDLKHFLKWKSRYWAYGGSAYEPIIDGGRINSYLALAWARFAEADFDYQNLVLVAFQEVEDALTSIEYLAKEAEKLAESVTASKKTYRVARDRYFAGLTFYLDVADAERDELEAERAYASAQGLRYSAVIHLIKALGGSWNIGSSCTP
jgi:multidrug efflux system outer membrane protein